MRAATAEIADAHSDKADEQIETIDAHPESVSEHVETAAAPEPVAASTKTMPPADPRDEGSRFRIFIIDSGWNHPASKVLQENFDLIHDLTHEDPIYVLDREKSVALLRKNKGLIGHDPIIAVHDLSPKVHCNRKNARGFRLHLGLQEGDAACLSALKMFARFINTHRDAHDLEADVRRKLNKQGLAGAIEIVGEAAHGAMMEA